MVREVKVVITGDESDLTRAFKSASGAASGFGSSLKGIATVAGGVLAAGLVTKGLDLAVEGFFGAIDGASDLAEETSKMGVVFNGAGADIEAWSKTTASAIGVSESAAKAAANSFGTLLEGTGKGDAERAQMSKDLTTLAADMASFNNADISETLDAINAGLRGESEPLRKFGVFLDDAALRAEAMAQGISDGKKPLTQQQKQLAAYGIIMKKTEKQQGDFARTSDGLANVQKENAAVMKDLADTFGKVLLPAVTEVGKFARDVLLPAFQTFATAALPVIQGAIEAVSGAISSLVSGAEGGGIGDLFAGAVEGISKFMGLLVDIGGFIAGNVIPPIVALAGALQPIGAKIIDGLIGAWNRLKPAFQTVFDFINSTVVPILVNTLIPALGNLLDTVGRLADQVLTGLGEAWTRVAPIIQEFFDWLVANVVPVLRDQLLPALANIASVVGGLLVEAWNLLAPVIEKIFGFIGDKVIPLVVDVLLPVLANLAGLVGNLLTEAFKILQPVLEAVFGFLRDVVGPLFENVIIPVLEFFFDIIGKIADLIGGALSTAFEHMPEAIDFMITPLEQLADLIGNVIGLVGDLIDAIANLPVVSDIGGFVGDIIGNVTGAAAPAGATVAGFGAAAAPAAAMTSTSMAVPRDSREFNVTTGDTTIIIQTTGDSLAIERAVNRALTRNARLNGGVVVPVRV